VTLVVNGEAHSRDVESRSLLVEFLREDLGLTGTHVGCDTSQCGACVVMVNGKSVKSCTMLAMEADGAEVTTVEGLAQAGELHPMQAAFHAEHALQCGFCTPGMLMAAQDLLKQSPCPDREQIREHLSGNYCRCTGYQAIVDAIETTAQARAGRLP
jgi:carbon-monoxide dehydrogenase small subunit